MLDADDGQIFTVTDLRQYAYCPRIVIYAYCLPLLRPTTYKMEAGVAAHTTAAHREQRRSLAAYGLQEGERQFDVPLESRILGLSGRVDMVIQVHRGEGVESIPVEYKHTGRRLGQHVRQQVAAYGMMLEEMWDQEVRRGFVYSLLSRKAEEITITRGLREEVRRTVVEMREMVAREVMPGPPLSRRGCVNCEFRRFCNDVL